MQAIDIARALSGLPTLRDHILRYLSLRCLIRFIRPMGLMKLILFRQ